MAMDILKIFCPIALFADIASKKDEPVKGKDKDDNANPQPTDNDVENPPTDTDGA